MNVRTIRKTVRFAKPFSLGGTDEVFPRGDYDVETDEELIEGLSFVAYQRVATYVRLPPQAGCSRTMTIDPAEFDAALARDLLNGLAEEEVIPRC